MGVDYLARRLGPARIIESVLELARHIAPFRFRIFDDIRHQAAQLGQHRARF